MNKLRLGMYAGSFNPFHIGHLDVVKQASLVFDKILVAKCVNPEKTKSDRYLLPVNFLTDMETYTEDFNGLLVDLIKKWEIDYDVTLVRGLRSGADLEYEQNFAAFLRGMYSQVKIVAFYCDPKLRHISSRSLRALETISSDEYRKYVITD